MLRPFSILWFAAIVNIVVAEPILQRRNNTSCVCPPFDLGYFPLAPSSGLVGGRLHCIYPDTSRCLYNPVRNISYYQDTMNLITLLFRRRVVLYASMPTRVFALLPHPGGYVLPQTWANTA